MLEVDLPTAKVTNEVKTFSRGDSTSRRFLSALCVRLLLKVKG